MTQLTSCRARNARLSRRAYLFWLSLLVSLTGCGGGVSLEALASPQSATSASTQGAIPVGEGPIEPGTYGIPKSAWSVVDFTVTMPEGWTVQYGHNYLKHSDAPDELGFYAVAVDSIYTDACKGDGVLVDVGPKVNDLAAFLLNQQGPVASGPVETTLGGYPAMRVDLTVPKGLDLETCRLEGAGLQIWYSPPADKYFVLLPDGIARVYILDIDGRRQVLLTQYRSATSNEDIAELQTILDSIHIER
jgi:hypothetical protein